MRLTKNFTREEFVRSRTAKRLDIDNTIPFSLMTNVIKTAEWLQILKERLCSHYKREIYIIISSGFRCKELNKAIRGSKNSAHMQGLAADITATSITPYELMLFIKENMKDQCFDQCILEHNEWVHIGFREAKMRNEFLEAYKDEDIFGKVKTKYKTFIKRNLYMPNLENST